MLCNLHCSQLLTILFNIVQSIFTVGLQLSCIGPIQLEFYSRSNSFHFCANHRGWTCICLHESQLTYNFSDVETTFILRCQSHLTIIQRQTHVETTSKFQVESTNIVSTLFRRLVANVEPTFAKRRQNKVDITLSTLSTYFQPNFNVETTSYTRWEVSIETRLNLCRDFNLQ